MNIALIAHDGRKQEMIEWVRYNADTLKNHNIIATGTTGKLIQKIGTNYRSHGMSCVCDYPFKDNVTCLLSGPLGGDSQAGALIAEGKIDALIFFCDNLIMQGHQNDVSALSRLASLYNIAFATNRTTADMILTSPLFGDEKYERKRLPIIDEYKNRQVFVI